jgi:hypothetical protein
MTAPSDWPVRMIIELLSSEEAVQIRSRGRSMWPVIPSGSLLELTPCRASELRSGHIAAFESNGRVVVHRVKRVTEHGVHFAGDTARQGDGCIAFAQVLGRARVLERRRLHLRLPRRSELRWFCRALVRFVKVRAWRH